VQPGLTIRPPDPVFRVGDEVKIAPKTDVKAMDKQERRRPLSQGTVVTILSVEYVERTTTKSEYKYKIKVKKGEFEGAETEAFETQLIEA
jgi:hypothetical protein